MEDSLESIHNLLTTDNFTDNVETLRTLLERIEEILKSSDKHGLENNIALFFGHDDDDDDVAGKNVIAFINRCWKTTRGHFVVDFLKCIGNLCILYPETLTRFVKKIIKISKECAFLVTVKSNSDVTSHANILIRTAVEKFHGTGYDFSNIYDEVVKQQIERDCDKVPKVYLAVFKLVGALSQFCPDSIQPVKCNLLKEVEYRLTAEERKPEDKRAYLVVEGSFEAINGLLFLFSLEDIKTNSLSGVLSNIYRSMKSVIDAEFRHRHTPHRVALSILENHTWIISHLVEKDYEYWHERLIKWLNHNNKEDREISLRAQNAFLREMARLLTSEPLETGGNRHKMLLYFYDYLGKKVTEEKNASNVAAIVEGIGVFAPAFAIILDSPKIEKLFEVLVQKIDSLFPQNDIDSSVFYLSEYLGALASVGGISKEGLKQHQLENLERISVKLVSACNTLPSDKLEVAVASIAVCCMTAFKAGSIEGLKDFINVIVYQGIIRACCQQPFVKQLTKSDFEETTSFKVVVDDYLPFWEKLLSIHKNTKVGDEGTARIKQTIVELVYEAMIESIVKMINNLDVYFEEIDFDDPNVVNTSGLKANNDADVAIVMNMEFLFSKLLPKIENRLHVKYMSLLLRNLISVSTKNPLLPSYHKLLATVLCIAESLGFFEADAKFEDSDLCQKEISYYIGDLLVNLHHYHKDIQEACLRVITSSSVELIASHLQQLPAAFEVLFHIGKSDLELASMGVSALGRWMSKLSREELTPFFKQIIPNLYPFLDNRRIKVAFPDHLMEYAQSITSNRSKHVSKRRKLVEDFRKESSLSETKLAKLQQSILMLFGRLDMQSMLSLLDQDYSDVIMSWSRKPVVSWEMKFQDLHVLIDLDDFAPRAMEIALQSSDTSSKDASFELLHAIFVIFLANTMNLTPKQTRYDHIHFLRKMLKGMFKLGCKTSDPVGRNIFSNLLKQTCHWYARNSNTKLVEIFVDSLLEALTCPKDIEVREFGAECLHEYIAWTIKPVEGDSSLRETTKQSDAAAFKKIANIISRITGYCDQPCPFKRQGAAMGFNRIYRELREQRDSVVTVFWLELFFSFGKSLMLPHPSREVFSALDHICRVFIKLSDDFNVVNKSRKKPSEFQGVLLKDAVIWLLGKCNNTKEKCREKCMSLVTQLVTKVKGANTLIDLIVAESIDVLELCEVRRMRSEITLMSDLMVWLDNLSASLHMFKWLKENKFDVLSVIRSDSSRVLKYVSFYITKISSCSAGNIDWLSEESSPFCPQLSAIDAFDRARCQVTVSILSFLSTLEEDLARLSDFFEKDVWQWLSRCLVSPGFIGFTTVSQNQLKTLRSVLSLLLTKLKLNKVNGLKENFVRMVISTLEDNEGYQLATGLNELIKCQSIPVKLDCLNALIVLKKTDLLDADDQNLIKDVILWRSDELIQTIMNCLVGESAKAMRPNKSQTSYLELLLDFAFLLKAENIPTLIECMCDETLLTYEDEDKRKTVKKGQHFTNTFTEKIFSHLCKFPTESVVELLEKFPEPFDQFREKISGETYRNQLTRFHDKYSFILKYLCTMLDRCRNVESSVKLNIAYKIDDSFPAEVQSELDSAIALIYSVRNFLPDHNIRIPGFKYLLKGLESCVTSEQPRILKTLLQISILNRSDVQNTSTHKEDEELRLPLKRLMHFGSSSKEWGANSQWFREVFSILLEFIQRTSNKVLAVLVANAIADDFEHPFREKFKSILGRPSSLKNNSASVLDEFYKIQANENEVGRLKPNVRVKFVQDFMLPIIHSTNSEMAEEFFLRHIKEIIDSLKEDIKLSDSSYIENLLARRSASILLIGELFSKFPASDLTSATNSIIIKSEEIENNKATLLGFCSRRMHTYLKEELNQATRKKIEADYEFYLSYKQIAFNTLVILISNTKRNADELKYYSVIFINIKFTMPREVFSISNMVFDELPKRKKTLIGIRRAVRAEKRRRRYSTSSNESYQLFTHSLESSSFANNIRNFDLSKAIMREHDFERSEHQDEDTDHMVVEVEADHLNSHPCMLFLCGTVMNLHKIATEATPTTSDGVVEIKGEPPDWINTICEQLQPCKTSNEEINTKLFLIKLLHNCNEINVNIFKPYAKKLLPAITNFIIENKDRCFGNKMSYMIGDILGMLASWSAVDTPDSNKIYQLLGFLFEKTPDDRKDVMKLNIETVKTVISSWKDNITIVPHNIILDFLTDTNSRSKLQSSLEFISCLLNYDIKPYSDDNLDRFYEALSKNLFNQNGIIRKNSAEILGMFYRFYSNCEGASVCSVDERFKLKELTKKILVHTQDKNDGLADMILFVSLMKNYYPQIVKYFIENIVGLMSMRVHLHLLQHVMDIVNKALELDMNEKIYPEELYLDVKCQLLRVFKLGDVENQAAALRVVLTLWHFLDDQNLAELIQGVVKHFSNHTSFKCRKAFYDVMMKVHEYYQITPSAGNIVMSEFDAAYAKDVVKHALVSGLEDSHEELRNQMFHFWNSDERLSTDLVSRLEDLFKLLYSPDLESSFVSLFLQLLLNVCQLHPAHFSCIFSDVGIRSNNQSEILDMKLSRVNSASVAPILVRTITTNQKSSSSSFGGSVGSVARIRSTQQSLLFQPTVNPDAPPLPTVGSSSLHSVAFDTTVSQNRQQLHGKRSYSGNDDYGDDDDEGDFKVPVYKARRLQSDKQKISQSAAYMNQRRNLMMQNELKEQKTKQESEVHLTRTYTKDDLPDRSLTNENIVVCLLKFAKNDITIASQLLTSLLKGMINGYQKKCSEPHNQGKSKQLLVKLISIIDEAFKRIMSNTKQATRGVITVVLDTCRTFASELSSSKCTDELFDVSNRSGLHSLGALVLENSLSSTLLMGTASQDENLNVWVNLARLYRSLGFNEIVQGIFEEKLANIEVREALEAESAGALKKAQSKYKSIAEKMTVNEQSDFIYEAYFNCMARMADWDGLKKAVLHVNEIDEMWNDSWSKENLLPWLFRSELNSALMSAKSKDLEPFMRHMEGWLENKEKSDYIKMNIGEELSMLHLVNKSIDRALEVSENNRKLFLEDWMQLSGLSHNLIMDKCLQLQRLMDIESALAVLKACRLNASDWFPNCIDLLQKWDSNPPLKSDALLHWEIRTKYRAHFCGIIMKKWRNPEIKKYESNYHLSLLDLSLQHENGYVATRVLRNANKCNPLWIAGKSRTELLQARKYYEGNVGTILSKVVSAWKTIDNLSPNVDLQVKLVSQKHVTEICNTLHSVFSTNCDAYYENLNKEGKESYNWLSNKFREIELTNSSCFLQKLFETGLNSLETAVQIAEEIVGVNSKADLAETYLTLAKYCQQQSDTDRSLTVESKMIESLLRAMKLGSKEARQLFPIILSLPSLAESHSDVFIEESKQVPAWMFLLWVNQMLARVDTEIGRTLEPLLLRLASEYPLALKYPLGISSSGYKSPTAKHTYEKLKFLASFDNLTSNFVEAIKYVLLPGTRLANCLMDIHISISCKESIGDINTKWNELEELVDALFSETPTIQNFRGSSYIQFKDKNKDLESQLRTLLNKRPTSENDGLYSKFRETLKYTKSLAEKLYLKFISNSENGIHSFSTWFECYPSLSDRIEMMGQYYGDSMPIPDKIVKISKFSDRLAVMSSIRKPVKISIIGNDGIEYGFLVKQGEDLRQDQRIMQAFTQMDSFLKLDNVNSPVMKYSLKTYNVIPFTTSVGLLSWVDGTTSLEDFVISCLSSKEDSKLYCDIYSNHQEWVASGAGHKQQKLYSIAQLYQKLYGEVSRTSAVSKFRANYQSLPQDIFRRGILELSQSAESYHCLRTQFGTSLSAMSVCHWLMGIGDRHLSNILICVGSGQLCGIDFGHAFGSATAMLGIPELLPFRLTPQMLNLFEPFRVTGLIKESMCRCLEILRKRKLLIMASIEVFIHEPLMDWAKQAKFAALCNDVDIADTDYYSLPQEKIDRARKKFDGANPVAVMAEDLKSGHQNKEYYNHVLSMLKGEQDNVRSSKKEYGLTAREQVECLIDLATDEHILGKSYSGLKAWV